MPTSQSTPKRGPGRPKKDAPTLAQTSAIQPDSYGSDTIGIAKDLTRFIQENKLSTQMQGKEFVNVEGWQYAGSRLGIVPIVEDILNLSTEQEIKYQAKVTLLQLSSGLTVGGGFAICSNKEGGKKFNQEFAIASMAQTRAIGKAYRNILAWIIRAAGFEATPAEEMEYSGNAPTAAPSPAAAPVSPSGAPARITLRAPVPLAELPPLAEPPVPAVVVPVEQPTMQISHPVTPAPTKAEAVAARHAQMLEEGIVMVSPLQVALIDELLQSDVITYSQRSTTQLNYLHFTRERAAISIGRLAKACRDKGATLPENYLRKVQEIKKEGVQLLQVPERLAVAGKLRAYVETHAAALGESEAERLISICGNPCFSHQQLQRELQSRQGIPADKAAA
jgi:hypothetical protein